MFVSEVRLISVGAGPAQVRLMNLVRDGWFSGASQAAYAGGLDQLIRVGPLGALPGVSRLVLVRFLDPVYRDDVMTMGVRWEAVGRTAGLFPVLDADIRLSPDGDESTWVALTGCYRPPLGAVGAGLDRVLMHRVATLTFSSLLTRLAGTLEGAPAVEAVESWRQDVGPELAPELNHGPFGKAVTLRRTARRD